MDVEIAVQDPAGVRLAREAGADRVELCVALVTGGLTPSLGLVEAAVAVGVPVHPLVRARPGGFVHDADELATSVRDVRLVVRAGAAGVVVGALRPDRTVDEDAVRALRDAAGGLPVTFHRAFDVVPDRLGALDRLAALGVHRVLTSGGAVTAPAGVGELARLVRHVRKGGTDVEVMAGGGVRVPDIPVLAGAGVDAVHLSARRPGPDRGPSGPGGGAEGSDVTDGEVVRAAVRAAGRAPARGQAATDPS